MVRVIVTAHYCPRELSAWALPVAGLFPSPQTLGHDQSMTKLMDAQFQAHGWLFAVVCCWPGVSLANSLTHTDLSPSIYLGAVSWELSWQIPARGRRVNPHGASS